MVGKGNSQVLFVWANEYKPGLLQKCDLETVQITFQVPLCAA